MTALDEQNRAKDDVLEDLFGVPELLLLLLLFIIIIIFLIPSVVKIPRVKNIKLKSIWSG